MSDSMPSFWRLRALILVALLVGLLATGCSQVPSNTPDSYTATSEGSTEPVTQINFMNACLEAETDADADEDAATDRCECIYAKIVDEIPFDDFKDFDSQLEDDPADVPAKYEEFAQDCADGEGSSSGESDGQGDRTTTTVAEGESTTTAPTTTVGEAG